MAGSRGLAAHVYDVRALRLEAQGLLQGRVGVVGQTIA